MKNRLSFKEYLNEYYKYPNTFSDVVDKEDEEKEKSTHDDKNLTASEKEQEKSERECDKSESGDGEQDYKPCKFTQWMRVAIAGEN